LKNSFRRDGKSSLENKHLVRTPLLLPTKTNLFLIGIRHFIVALIVKNASDERTMHNEKVYINKLNLVLVEVGPRITLVLMASRSSNKTGPKTGQSLSQK
jgi:hypothetical protein